jgi:hypothetical protein
MMQQKSCCTRRCWDLPLQSCRIAFPSFGIAVILCEHVWLPRGLDDLSGTSQVWLSLGEMRHLDRLYGALMCCVGTTCSASLMDDHGRDEGQVNGEVSWRLASFFASMTALHDQDGNQLLRNSELSRHYLSSVPLGGDTYFRSFIDPTFPFRILECIIHRAPARSQIHHSQFHVSTPFALCHNVGLVFDVVLTVDHYHGACFCGVLVAPSI